ncbi:hypothetical protein EV702DRAFT_1204069 [Suillus placidus]|uniref:Uncharacterized protein n=1 Tax=Suillus placidus TaxID=48579 RepID=A0A9P7CWX0_9AGAM|nr:hypothetical protein EV702DRAFT_1204069 [Suillus placidus]
MAYVAGRIAESFKTDLFVIWSEDTQRSSSSIAVCSVVVKKMMMLAQVPGIQKVFLQQHDKVYIDKTGSIKTKLETDGINLKTVMCINSVDFTPHAAIMKELHGVIKFDGSYCQLPAISLSCAISSSSGVDVESQESPRRDYSSIPSALESPLRPPSLPLSSDTFCLDSQGQKHLFPLFQKPSEASCPFCSRIRFFCSRLRFFYNHLSHDQLPPPELLYLPIGASSLARDRQISKPCGVLVSRQSTVDWLIAAMDVAP